MQIFVIFLNKKAHINKLCFKTFKYLDFFGIVKYNTCNKE